MIHVAGTKRLIADLQQKRNALLGGRTPQALSAEEQVSFINYTTQLENATEELQQHEAGNKPREAVGGDFNFSGYAGQNGGGAPEHKKTISRMLQSVFRTATAEQREEIQFLAGYLRGGVQAAANFSPTSDGGLLIPSFVQGTIERVYAAFHPVVDVCRLFATDTGADTVFPVMDDTESAQQLDAAAATGADATVTGDTPPTTLTGPTMKAYKVSSKPVFVPRELSTDTDIDIVSEVIGALLARIIRFENTRFTLGTGVNQAQGFLTACNTFEGTGTLDLDGALDLAYAVPALFRPNGVYMMSDGTAKFLRKIKTGLSGDKRTIWTDYNQREGTPGTLHGYPVYINNDMHDVNTDGTYGGGLSSVLAFGDFSKFVVRQAENNQAYLYRYQVPAKDGTAVILFRRTDSKLLVSNAIAKLSVGSS